MWARTGQDGPVSMSAHIEPVNSNLSLRLKKSPSMETRAAMAV